MKIITHKAYSTRNRGRGVTLVELVVVLVILTLMGALVLPSYEYIRRDANERVTEANLNQLRDVIMGAPGYYSDMNNEYPWSASDSSRVNHPQLRYLFYNPDTEDTTNTFDPITRIGWRGPYLLNATCEYTVDDTRNFSTRFGETGDPAVADGWGEPIVIQLPAANLNNISHNALNHVRLISAGPNRIIDTMTAWITPTSVNNADGNDDIVLFLRVN